MFPKLSHFQYFALSILLGVPKGRWRPGSDIRCRREVRGMSGPAFYQAMARMERDKLVRGRYCKSPLDGKRVREYEATVKGHKEWEKVSNWYLMKGAEQ